MDARAPPRRAGSPIDRASAAGRLIRDPRSLARRILRPGGTGAGGSSGGAIATNGGSVMITNSTLAGNFSGVGGNGGKGGPDDKFNTTAPAGGNSGNGSAGGGVYADGGATVTLTNVTVSANQVGGLGTPGPPGDSAAAVGSSTPLPR